jgi:enoyl-CoA hydratase
MNLVNRVVPKGKSTLEEAKALARLLASHPQLCMRNDRMSAIMSQGRTEEDAMRFEFEVGMRSMRAADMKGAIGSFFQTKEKGKIWTGPKL